MELKHHFSVPSSLAETWHSFNQLEEIAPCFPGAVLTSVEGDTFTGTVKVKLGPIAMLYTGTGEFLSRDEDSHTVVISAQGKDKRGNGTAGATVTAVLTADGDGTVVDVSTDMNVTGKPAQFGRGVIQDISDKLLEAFVQCVISKATGAEEDVSEPAASHTDEAAASATPPLQDRASKDSVSKDSASKDRTETDQPELDLGSAVLPVLAKRFAPFIVALIAVVALAVCLGQGKKMGGCKKPKRR
ncbi:SRPBCC family protein [Arthrobacter cryoconiti]|uniref:SRPBCC family protein n=1 Tax=Arthrobacter cryoconiti TaxID=748907 RepID=A0ABV8QWR3_9MICC|nr:SRPBCC family protein [Arthrobacter cryoconiti]MCC9069662.1 SRPBCC family protein [Arthrobacter cryoconiti]